ncbi:MAG: hypothetical protein RLZZ575_505 [Actinomycetota bacterium]
MSEYQITSWKNIPSLVTVREGDKVVKTQLPQRFQEAIDEAAMRLNKTDADSYMNGWNRSEWIKADGEPAIIAEQVVAGIEKDFSEENLAALLDELGKN